MNINLLKGDCLELMKTIPDNSIDLVLADVPYGTTACKWDTVIPFEPMWKELKRIRKDNAAVCLFGSEPFSSHLRMSNIKEFKYDWIWVKNRASGISLAKHQPMRASEILSLFFKSRYYPIKCERIDKTKRQKNKHKYKNFGSNITLLKNTEYKTTDKLKFPDNILRFDVLPNNSKIGYEKHPTQKPVALLEYLIKTYTLEGETVLDFTMGSGSTGVAAKNLNRNFIGIEKDDKYFEIAQKRIEHANAKEA